MKPQHARFTFAAFLALSLVIVFNALYMQSDAGFSTRDGFAGSGYGGQATGTSSDQMPVSAKGSDLLRAIRRELSQRNYFPGNAGSRLDGRVDAMTMGAIMAYQYDSGLEVTGLASDELLKNFLFGVANPSVGADKTPVLSDDTHQLVAEIQGILSAKGHYGGKIDGIYKNRTRDAVMRFERDRGLPVTGRISGLLVQELTRMTGVGFSASQK